LLVVEAATPEVDAAKEEAAAPPLFEEEVEVEVLRFLFSLLLEMSCSFLPLFALEMPLSNNHRKNICPILLSAEQRFSRLTWTRAT
jgi:hypothetical protein